MDKELEAIEDFSAMVAKAIMKYPEQEWPKITKQIKTMLNAKIDEMKANLDTLRSDL